VSWGCLIYVTRRASNQQSLFSWTLLPACAKSGHQPAETPLNNTPQTFLPPATFWPNVRLCDGVLPARPCPPLRSTCLPCVIYCRLPAPESAAVSSGTNCCEQVLHQAVVRHPEAGGSTGRKDRERGGEYKQGARVSSGTATDPAPAVVRHPGEREGERCVEGHRALPC
jgi:hypothetical protein